MPSIVTKIEFYNAAKIPVEKMGEILNPDDNFEVCFTNPPVTDNYYNEIYAIATFDNGSYSVASSPVENYLGIIVKSVFDDPMVAYPTTETEIDLPMTLDLSLVTEFTIEAAAIPKFVLEYKLATASSWTAVDITPLTLLNNEFTGTYELDITSDDIYAVRVKAIDSNGDTSGYSDVKYVVKNIFLGWDNTGTDAVTWDNAGSDKVLY